MKKYGKLYLLLVLTISLSLTAFAPQTASGEAEMNRPDKIDAALWDVMCASSEDEWIPINILLCGMDETELQGKIKTKTGMDPAVFLDEARFEKEVASKIREAVEKAFRAEAAQPAGDVAELSDASLASLKTALSAEVQYAADDDLLQKITEISPNKIADELILNVRCKYQSEKSKVLKEEQLAVNNAFVKTHVETNNNEVRFVSYYIPSLYITSKKADILYYAQQDDVVSICYDDPDFQLVPALNDIPAQVGADSSTGTKSVNFNDGNGFLGHGISIGILEAGGVIDIASPHFDEDRMIIVPNGNEKLVADTHASLVTAIAAGERVGYNSVVYTGIVPEATVYVTRASSVATFVSGLHALHDSGAQVINISLVMLGSQTYTYMDRDLDYFINTTGVTCVVAAGNNANGYGDGSAYINSPGYAMNCITVGNLRTKSSGASGIGAKPYSLHPSSSWEEPNSLPSEPDICAPGTWVRAVRTSTGTNPFFYDLEGVEPTGTSFAAPVVTGIVAQMMEEHSAKIGNPQAVKAKIMNTALPSSVTTVNNGTESNPYLRDLSGAGMVNAARAMSGYAYKYAWNHGAVEPNYITQFTVSLSAGQKLRATLAFSNKNTNAIIQNGSQYYDMDLRLVDAATGAVLSAAEESRNNVEIVEYTASAARSVCVQTRIVRGVSHVSVDWALEVDRY
ncbi:MAG TPA: hypothetical protein DCX96_08045 [Oscillibacter sp.]|nr:hypothetical protein [Oscillibacter sp.]